jgi:transposase
MKEDRERTTERVDDGVVFLSLMHQMELPNRLGQHLPRHHLHHGGWVAPLWRAHLISQGDHRTWTVRDWVRHAQSTLEQVTGRESRETDGTDDRLTMVRRHVSDVSRWHSMEHALGRYLVWVSAWEDQPIRREAIPISGSRGGGEGRVWPFGQRKDDPTGWHITVLRATRDPLGLPLAVSVVSGEQVDDPWSVPTITRVRACRERKGVVIVGDGTRSALAPRASLQECGQDDLKPLAQVGETAASMAGWMADGGAHEKS